MRHYPSAAEQLLLCKLWMPCIKAVYMSQLWVLLVNMCPAPLCVQHSHLPSLTQNYRELHCNLLNDLYAYRDPLLQACLQVSPVLLVPPLACFVVGSVGFSNALLELVHKCLLLRCKGRSLDWYI